MQRIAMLSVHTSPLAALGGKKTGGMNVYVRDLSRELGQRGLAVDVFTRRQDTTAAPVVDLGNGVRVIHVPTGPEKPLGSAEIYPYLPEFVENAKAFQSTYDVIFSHYWLSGWAAHELRAWWSAPVVQMFHTLGRMKNRIARTESEHEAGIRIFTETDVMSWADQIIAATPAERAQLLWLYRADRRKITIIPPGVDLERFRPIESGIAKAQIGMHAQQRMFLFVGRIEPLKGIDTILHAAARLNDTDPALLENLCFCVIGGDLDDKAPDTEINRLKRLCVDLGLGDRITFLGARGQDMLPYYYCAAEALIMPSDYESFGMVALEAMACGTPVIASEIGGLAFLVQDGVNGFHVPTRDPVVLAERIKRVLTQPDRLHKMGEMAHQTAVEYRWPLIADQIMDVFAAVSRHKN